MVISQTPFRISFFGGGTDYPAWYKQHGGCVISTTINKYCYITTRLLPPFFDHKFRIRYTVREETKTVQQIKHPSVRETLKYLRFEKGLELVHTSDVPAWSGLGTSSAFTVGLLHSLYTLMNKKVDKKKLAVSAIEIEQSQIKENVGSQDQVNAAFGGLNKITFYPSGKIHVLSVPMDKSRLHLLEEHLMLFFTGYQRKASTIAKHIITNTNQNELQLNKISSLTSQAYKILTTKTDLIEMGKLLNEYWNLKKSLSVKVSNLEIDQIYEAAMNAGAVGGKLLGAGAGGFFLFYVKPEDREKIKKRLNKLLYVPFEFENQGSQIIYYKLSEKDYGYSI